MNISKVIINPTRWPDSGSRVMAYASFVVDGGVVVKNVRLIDGPGGRLIQFPNRVKTTLCPECRRPAEILASYCPGCGSKLPDDRVPGPAGGRGAREDVVHPASPGARLEIHEAIGAAYEAEMARRGASKGVAS